MTLNTVRKLLENSRRSVGKVEDGTRRFRNSWLYVPILLCLGTPGFAATIVGKTEFARGAAAAQLPDQAPRLLGKDAEVYRRDVIQTGASSFAIVGFQDAAKVTVRPNSKLTINDYLEDYAELGLHEGGVRGASGSIAKLLPGQFKVETPVATVEIHNAKFDIRYCENDCAQEEKTREPVEPRGLAAVVGRVATLRGQASSTNPAGETRSLGLGAPLHEKDVITTGADSYAMLMFRDASKITLEQQTEFHIEAQKYFADQPDKNEAVYRFVRGGMRALTGAIGKDIPEKYQVSTPVATTGIRGTGYDLACRGTCSSRRIQGSPEFISAALPDGLYSLVWQGRIRHDNDAGAFDLPVGRAGHIANRQSPMILLPSIPAFMQKNPAPRPDQDDSSLDDLFGFNFIDGVPPGLYVHVREGHVRMVTPDGHTLNLGTGEVGYVGHHQQHRADPTRAAGVPPESGPEDATRDEPGIQASCSFLPSQSLDVVPPEGCRPETPANIDSDGDGKRVDDSGLNELGERTPGKPEQPSTGTTGAVGQVYLTRGDDGGGQSSGTDDKPPGGTPGTGAVPMTRLQFPRAFLTNDPVPEPETGDLNTNLFTLLDDDDDASNQTFFECLCPI